MSDFLSRMHTEYSEVNERYTKLCDLLSKNKPDFLDDKDWELLNLQAEHMSGYLKALNERIHKASN